MIMLLAAALKAAGQRYWHPVASGTRQKLLCISFGNELTGYIGGRDSTLLKTTDGGHSWQRIAAPGDGSVFRRDILDVQFVSASTGYAVLGSDTQSFVPAEVYKTENGGGSWTVQYAGVITAARSYFFREGEGFVIGSAFFAGMAISRIRNQEPDISAYRTFSNTINYFTAVDFRDSLRGMVAGDFGLLARTFNGGESWDTLRIPTDSTVYALAFLNDSVVMAATHNPGGSLMISEDSGRTWMVDFNSLTFDYPVMRALARSGKDSFIAVGASTTYPGKGTIYWHDNTFNRYENTDHSLYGVAMANDTVAYAVGDSGLIVTNFTGTPPTGVVPPGYSRVEFKVYPNPAYAVVTAELPVAFKIRVTDMSGRLLLTEPALRKKHMVDLSGLAPGVYILEADTGQERFSVELLRR